MNAPGFLRVLSDGVTLAVKVQPRASANEIVDVSGEELRVRVTAPPVDSAANEALVRFLSQVLNCPRNRVELLRGTASRHKVLKIHGLGAEAVMAALRQNR